MSGHISTALIVEDDTERDCMHLKLPLAHPHSTAYEKEENESKKEKNKKNKNKRKELKKSERKGKRMNNLT